MNGRWRSFSRVVQVCIPSLLLAGIVLGAPKKTDGPTLTPQVSGTTNRLQAVSPVNDQVVWASGTGGTYARTTDGGATWVSAQVPGAELLQFRDVEGVSAEVLDELGLGSELVDGDLEVLRDDLLGLLFAVSHSVHLLRMRGSRGFVPRGGVTTQAITIPPSTFQTCPVT